MQMAIDLFYFSLPVLQQPLITEAVSKLKITKRKMPQQRLVTDIPIPHIYIYIYILYIEWVNAAAPNIAKQI